MDIKEYLNDNRKLIAIILVAIIIAVLFYYNYKDKDSANSVTLVQQEDSQDSGEIIVHIAGEVKEPGIIKLKKGQRLYEALEIAGGTTEDADIDTVNLAMVLEDQQKVSIPSKTEEKDQVKDDKININTADKSQLTELPGIGDTIAESIVDYREKNNGFKNLEELKNVHRIGDATFNRIKDKVSIY